MKLAVLMDPLDRLKWYKDNTLGMIKTANDLGWFCCFFTTADISCVDGQVTANLSSIEIKGEIKPENATIVALGERHLNEFDIILIRNDPPFNMEYIYATYALELVEKQGVLVANKPHGLREVNEKFSIQNFPQCCVPTLVTKNIHKLTDFWKTHQNVIFKPLDLMGGRGIFQVDERKQNLAVILDTLTHQQTTTIVAQKFIPDLFKEGDKRILLIDGNPIPYALARHPAEGESRANLDAGGNGIVVPLTERDRWICSEIAPFLRENGLYFVGIDVIGNYLTEINVTSPTCAMAISAETGLDILREYLLFLSYVISA